MKPLENFLVNTSDLEVLSATLTEGLPEREYVYSFHGKTLIPTCSRVFLSGHTIELCLKT